jgi:nitrous oxidase accessory protein NosD
MTKRNAFLFALLLGLAASGIAIPAQAAIRRVPEAYRSIQAAVDASRPGDVVDVGPGSYCGATIDVAVELVGHQTAIVGCDEGPVLFGDLRAGFYLPGADGQSGASGTHIEGFLFDGRGISAENLEPLALGVIARFANGVRVEHNLFLGGVQAITNTAGDNWTIANNRIEALTLFDCTGDLCAGGDGIVIQIARDDVAAPGGPSAAVNRPEGNVVIANEVSGAIPDGFDEFSMAGIFVFAADDTLISRNQLAIPDNPKADASGDGVLISNVCCGEPALTPGARNTAVFENDGRGSQFAVVVDGTGGANTAGLFLSADSGTVMVQGQLVTTGGGRRLTRLDRGPRRTLF